MSVPLASLRAYQRAFLPDAATILRYVETSTSDGVEADWSPIAVAVPCRVSTLASSGTETIREAAAVVRAVSEWTIWLPALTDVTLKDRIMISGADRTDDRTFEVTRVGERSYETVRECICTLLS